MNEPTDGWYRLMGICVGACSGFVVGFVLGLAIGRFA